MTCLKNYLLVGNENIRRYGGGSSGCHCRISGNEERLTKHTLRGVEIIIRDDKHISMKRPNTYEEERLISIEGEKRITSETPKSI